MYKRISSSLDIEDLRELQVEIIDRFGLLPKQLKLLFQLTQLKLRALTFGIKKIDANVNSGRIEFGPQTRVDPGSIVQLIQAEPKSYKLGGANQLQFVHACSEAQEKLQFIDDLLDKLKLAEQKAA